MEENTHTHHTSKPKRNKRAQTFEYNYEENKEKNNS
jgi:hypothetical protein